MSVACPFRVARRAAAAFLVLTGASIAASAFQSVHVVVGGAGNALQAAIDAANEGDTVLVHGGQYDAITIASKSLTVVCEPVDSTWVAGVRIADLAAGQYAVVSGLRVVAPPFGQNPPPDCVLVTNCAGSVRLQSLHAELLTPNGNPALRVVHSPDVALTASRMRGSHAALSPAFGIGWTAGAGIHCTQSRIAVFDSVVVGGFGLSGSGTCSGGGFFVLPDVGAPGIAVDAGSTVLVNGGEVAGGRGGIGLAPRCECSTGQLLPGSDGARGGDAFANAPGSTVGAQDVFLRAGAGGNGWGPIDCGSGPTGATTNGSEGALWTHPISSFAGPALRLAAPTIARAGQPMALSARGTPGDAIFLARSFTARWVPSFPAHGVLLAGPTGRRLPLFVMPPDGHLPFVLPAPTLPPAADGQPWFFQVFARDPSGALRVGAAAVTTVVDPAY